MHSLTRIWNRQSLTRVAVALLSTAVIEEGKTDFTCGNAAFDNEQHADFVAAVLGGLPPSQRHLTDDDEGTEEPGARHCQRKNSGAVTRPSRRTGFPRMASSQTLAAVPEPSHVWPFDKPPLTQIAGQQRIRNRLKSTKPSATARSSCCFGQTGPASCLGRRLQGRT